MQGYMSILYLCPSDLSRLNKSQRVWSLPEMNKNNYTCIHDKIAHSKIVGCEVKLMINIKTSALSCELSPQDNIMVNPQLHVHVLQHR